MLATWVPDGAVAEFFGVLAKYSPTPPPPSSPMAWGEPEHVTTLLGDDFTLSFERGVSHAYHDDEDDIWNWYASGFGPIRALVNDLEPNRRAALKRDVDRYHAHYKTAVGLNVAREYLMIVGRRR